MDLEMMMSVKLQILLLLISPVALLAASSQPFPLANCPKTCGNITIPFPFGLGPGCFLDEDYEIVCKNDTIPRLKKFDLEVMNISLLANKYLYSAKADNNIITVRYPIVYSNSCIRGETPAPVNFTASPFSFSEDHNVFAAVGCDTIAIMESDDSSFVGCRTKCTGKNTRQYSNFSGYDCCLSTIPKGLQVSNVSFQNDNSADHDCQFAFLVNSSWFQLNLKDLYALQDEGYVPVVLKWGLTNITLATSLAGEIDPSFLVVGLTVISCYTIMNNTITRLIQCNCEYGYAGNPYLQSGCQDINECEISEQNTCSAGRLCKNIPGSYECVRNRIPMILAIVFSSGFGLLLLIVLSWWAYKIMKKRREAKLKEKFFKRNGGLILQQQHLSSPEGINVEKGKLFSTKELEKATDHFNIDRVVGQGGQGTVYKGMLTDGRIVAIKKSIVMDEDYVEQFINEVVILSQINHRNVVNILGCCLETEVPLLVYEFIPNGTLSRYLHDPNQDFPLSWKVRLRIATEIASALSYLHSSASIPIYHRDIKTTNILLDKQYRAKIADFGTSRSVSLDQTHVTTLVQGTFGYLDPEYFQSCQFTDKSDVYSFGVVLVELLTGQKAVSSIRINEGRGLATFFIISMEENCLFDIVDDQVLKQGGEEEITAVANLAKRCLNLKGRKRPTMKEVVMELEGIPDRGGTHELQQTHETHDQILEPHDAFLTSTQSEIDADTVTVTDIYPLLLIDDTL